MLTGATGYGQRMQFGQLKRIEYRRALGQPDRLSALAVDLVGRKVAVIADQQLKTVICSILSNAAGQTAIGSQPSYWLPQLLWLSPLHQNQVPNLLHTLSALARLSKAALLIATQPRMVRFALVLVCPQTGHPVILGLNCRE